ncbi:hypothetical protein HOG16_02420 [Candidatus Woesearchaeota archaeon]|jgi:Icc-related predicted phosphoesterase|nr:hypothetical protein [Candidatus Woesearchaeota archaeon]MBT4321951.1 hypothetical protein [Candidatus Woesearchaeota archaeon]MBT4631303.1 hypothetical protein [Candidatus Woesearchaeota archaeon]
MKFLIIGDLHGKKPKIHFKDFDAIIAPGDFCSDESKKYMFRALKERLVTPKSKTEWYDIVGKKEAKKIIMKSLSDGRKILEKLNSYGVPVYIVPGNWDWTPFVEREINWNFLKKDHFKKLVVGLKNIINLHEKKVIFNGINFIGHGISSGPEYPQYKEDLERYGKNELKIKKLKYEKHLGKIDNLFKNINLPVIFLSHNVPFNTKIDKINNKYSPRNGQHFGSMITREIIEKYNPLICIGGHMHEHFGKDKIGKTVCVNAGFGSDVNILLEIKNGKIKQLKFHKGK